MFSLIQDPNTDLVPPTSRPHISIDWFIKSSIKDNWMDQWYMVFMRTYMKQRYAIILPQKIVCYVYLR